MVGHRARVMGKQQTSRSFTTRLHPSSSKVETRPGRRILKPYIKPLNPQPKLQDSNGTAENPAATHGPNLSMV